MRCRAVTKPKRWLMIDMNIFVNNKFGRKILVRDEIEGGCSSSSRFVIITHHHHHYLNYESKSGNA